MPLLVPVGRGWGEVQGGPLNRVRLGADWWVRLEGRLRLSAQPLGGAVCRGHVQYSAFAPSSSEVAVGLWPL